jgi:hypothetical protein
LFALAASCLPAQAVAACTPITAVPYSIIKSGSYCLTQDLYTSITSGAAISVAASEVTIDFGGWMIANFNTNNQTQASGVLHSGGRGLIVRNGRIRGFLYGVRSTASEVTVQDMKLDTIARAGISLMGTGTALVEHNHIVNSGGPNYYGPLPVMGIEVNVTGAIVEHNTIVNITAMPAGSEIGIWLMNGVARDNTVTDYSKPSGNVDSVGVVLSGSLATGNAINNFQTGINGSSSVAEHNALAHCTTDYAIY